MSIQADMPEDEREQWRKDLAREDSWNHNGDMMCVHFHADIGEVHAIDLYLVNGLHYLGALASVEAHDPAPECPLMHVLAVEAAGPEPLLLFGFPQAHQSRLVHTMP